MLLAVYVLLALTISWRMCILVSYHFLQLSMKKKGYKYHQHTLCVNINIYFFHSAPALTDIELKPP